MSDVRDDKKIRFWLKKPVGFDSDLLIQLRALLVGPAGKRRGVYETVAPDRVKEGTWQPVQRARTFKSGAERRERFRGLLELIDADGGGPRQHKCSAEPRLKRAAGCLWVVGVECGPTTEIQDAFRSQIAVRTEAGGDVIEFKG